MLFKGIARAVSPRFGHPIARRYRSCQVCNRTHSVVAIFGTHTQAEEAVKELRKCGCDMK